MPYIPEDRAGEMIFPETAGELNAVLSQLIAMYLEGRGNDVCYQDLNEVVGALECCKQEFVSRILNNYEHKKLTTTHSFDPYQQLSETLGDKFED
jgi:hypothetical protein